MLLAFGAGAGLLYASVRHFTPRVQARLAREGAELDEALKDLFYQGVTARTLLRLKYIAAPALALVLFLLSGSLLFALVFGAVLFVTPGAVLKLAAKRRRQRLEGQVLDLIGSLSATTKAGMNLVQSVEEVAARMPPPLSQEFTMVLERLRAGQTLETALRACDERLHIPSLSLVLQSLVVNEQRGGRLPELLQNLHTSLREIGRVEERVKTETSGIRLSSRIMAAMPLVIGLLLYMVSPDHILMLFNTLLGNAILVLAALFDYVGFTIIRKLGDLEV